MKSLCKFLFIILLITPFTFHANTLLAQENNRQPLDGAEIEYSYTDGRAVIVSFDNGLLDFRWIAGPATGITGEDLAYKAQMVSDGIYLVNWQMLDAKNFISIVINLETNMVYGSTLMFYGTERENSSFEEAVLNRVEL